MLTLASLVVKAAILRGKQGAHYRTDYPATDDQIGLNLVFKLEVKMLDFTIVDESYGGR